MQYKRAKQIAEDKGVSVSTVWRWVHAGILPAPIKISNRVTVWRASDVDKAIEQRAAESNTDVKNFHG